MVTIKVSSRCKTYTAKAEPKRLTTCGARDTYTRSNAAAQALSRHRVGARGRTTKNRRSLGPVAFEECGTASKRQLHSENLPC